MCQLHHHSLHSYFPRHVIGGYWSIPTLVVANTKEKKEDEAIKWCLIVELWCSSTQGYGSAWAPPLDAGGLASTFERESAREIIKIYFWSFLLYISSPLYGLWLRKIKIIFTISQSISLSNQEPKHPLALQNLLPCSKLVYNEKNFKKQPRYPKNPPHPL